MKVGGRLARNINFEVASLWGKLQNLSLSKVSKQVVVCCNVVLGGRPLRDIPTCFITCLKSFCWTGATLLRRSQKMSCMFRGRHLHGHVAWQEHFRRVALRVFCELHCQSS